MSRESDAGRRFGREARILRVRRPGLVYIVGSNRSGSTILSAVLGSQAGMVAAGELNALLFDDVGEVRLCSCAKVLEECPFWSPVLQRWRRDLAPAGFEDYRRLEQEFERFRSLPRLTRASRRPSSSFQAYLDGTDMLLRRIAEAGSADYVVDASKTPIRALALLRGGGTDLSLVHLVRDPRAVAWSKRKLLRWEALPNWLRSPVGTVMRVTSDWILTNLFAERVARTYPQAPYVRIRYEDLTAAPASVLQDAGSRVGLDLRALGDRAARGEAFSFSHIMAGNVARHKPPRPLVRDDEWQTASPPWMRSLVWALCGPLARRYGYRP